MESVDRDALLLRLIRLWLAFANNTNVAEVLSAIAGTNLRNAARCATAWCLSKELSDLDLSPGELQEALRVVRRSMMNYVCDYVGRSICEGIGYHLDMVSLKRIYDVEGREATIDITVEAICRVACECLRDGGFIRRRGDHRNLADEGPRLVVCDIAKEVLKATVQDAPDDVPGLGNSSFPTHMLLLIQQSLNAVYETGFDEPLDACRDVLEMLKVEWKARIKRIAEAEGLIVEGIALWKIEHMLTVAIEVFNDESLMELKLDEIKAGLGTVPRKVHEIQRFIKQRTATAGLLASRFKVEKLMLDEARSEEFFFEPSTLGSFSQFGALNVFTLDGRTVCPAILRVLGVLADAGKSWIVSIRRLVEDFERHGMGEGQLREAMSAMVSHDRRLVFSGICDYYEGTNQLFEERERPVRLSWAGHGYFFSLIRMPVYLQWAFEGIVSLKEESRRQTIAEFGNLDESSLEYRFAWTAQCFRSLIQDEIERLRSLWESNPTVGGQLYMRRQEVARQSLTCDLFFSSLGAFFPALNRHFLNVAKQADARRIAPARGIAKYWISCAEDWMTMHGEIFGQKRDDWELDLHNAKKQVSEFLPA